MQVFKTYFRVLWKNFPVLLIYIGIFFFFVSISTAVGQSDTKTVFSADKCQVVIINEDADSEIASGLSDYISSVSDVVSVENDPQSISDALFYGYADYVLTIPEGFTSDFLAGSHELTVQTRAVAGSTAKTQMDMLVSKYLEITQLYVESDPSSTIDSTRLSQISSLVSADMQKQTSVVMTAKGHTDSFAKVKNYYTFLPYSILAVVILGVATIMITFSKRTLRNRIQCSPTPATKQNLALLLGNLCFAALVWLFYILAGFVFTKQRLTDPKVILLVVNTLAFTISALSISFLLSFLMKTINSLHSVANVIALGTSFLSGVFVPQEYLGNTVLQIAAFTPSYWYVSAVNQIYDLPTVSFSSSKPIIYCMLIQLAFAFAFLFVSILLGRQRSRKTV